MEKSKGAGPHLASIEVLIEGSAAIAAVKAKQLDLEAKLDKILANQEAFSVYLGMTGAKKEP